MDFWDKMELGANWIADPKYNLIQNGSMIQIGIFQFLMQIGFLDSKE